MEVCDFMAALYMEANGHRGAAARRRGGRGGRGGRSGRVGAAPPGPGERTMVGLVADLPYSVDRVVLPPGHEDALSIEQITELSTTLDGARATDTSGLEPEDFMTALAYFPVIYDLCVLVDTMRAIRLAHRYFTSSETDKDKGLAKSRIALGDGVERARLSSPGVQYHIAVATRIIESSERGEAIFACYGGEWSSDQRSRWLSIPART